MQEDASDLMICDRRFRNAIIYSQLSAITVTHLGFASVSAVNHAFDMNMKSSITQNSEVQ